MRILETGVAMGAKTRGNYPSICTRSCKNRNIRCDLCIRFLEYVEELPINPILINEKPPWVDTSGIDKAIVEVFEGDDGTC